MIVIFLMKCFETILLDKYTANFFSILKYENIKVMVYLFYNFLTLKPVEYIFPNKLNELNFLIILGVYIQMFRKNSFNLKTLLI